MKSISQILSEFPEWEDDWKAHALFCAYDEDASEEYLVSFWKRAILKIFDEYIQVLSIQSEDLKSLVQRKGRTPLGLINIIKELINREDIISVEELKEKVESKLSSLAWGSWIGNKITGIWKKPLEVNRIASHAKLKRFSDSLLRWSKDVSRNAFTKEEIIKKFNLPEDEVEILVDFMFLQGLAINFKEKRGGYMVEMVKFKTSIEEELIVNPGDSAIVALNLTLTELDNRISELEKTKEYLHSKVLQELKNQEKLNAKHFLMRRKMVEQKIESLLNSRIKIEEQLLSLSSTFTNKNILNTLKATNEAFKNISVNIKEIEDAIETSKENLENYRDVNNILSQGNEDDEELLKEFESLDQLELPSVPSYSIKPKEKEEVRQPEYILNS